jgi:Xaa-Pro aminopeptidase
MRIVLLAVILSGIASAEAIPKDEFRTRRAELRKNLNGTVILFGRTEGNDEVYGFVQEPNFYYLSGWTEPGAILILNAKKEMLFLPHHNETREHFTGRRASAEDQNARALTGFDSVLPIEKLESSLANSLDESENVYTLAGSAAAEKVKARFSFRTFSDAGPLVAKLRVKKSPAELAAIQHSVDVTVQGHRAAWDRIASGLFEYQIAATVSNVYMENGCERHAYAPIVGSGPNGAVLHYSANKRRMDQGEVVVMDTAAQCDEYASDVTRTIPVGGKFTARQRELYDIVLGAQKAAIAAVKPGARLGGPENSINAMVKTYFATHGKDLHGKSLEKYYTHGIGHQVGLDVHDADTRGPLEAGMVITIEPGLYIPEENIGIRIEDVILVTETGAKVLSAALPREPEELEKALAKSTPR